MPAGLEQQVVTNAIGDGEVVKRELGGGGGGFVGGTATGREATVASAVRGAAAHGGGARGEVGDTTRGDGLGGREGGNFIMVRGDGGAREVAVNERSRSDGWRKEALRGPC